MMPMTEVLPVRLLLFLILSPVLAIAAGLLIFFLGRRYVRRKHGKVGKRGGWTRGDRRPGQKTGFF